MQAIAQAENRDCNPLDHNLSSGETHYNGNGDVICVGSYNVLQVGCLHYNGEDRDDIATNVKIANRVYTERGGGENGYRAWTMYRNGTFAQFLK